MSKTSRSFFVLVDDYSEAITNRLHPFDLHFKIAVLIKALGKEMHASIRDDRMEDYLSEVVACLKKNQEALRRGNDMLFLPETHKYIKNDTQEKEI
jgi:hypothetical protein